MNKMTEENSGKITREEFKNACLSIKAPAEDYMLILKYTDELESTIAEREKELALCKAISDEGIKLCKNLELSIEQDIALARREGFEAARETKEEYVINNPNGPDTVPLYSSYADYLASLEGKNG